jgi:catechol 2,3-dioxygenase
MSENSAATAFRPGDLSFSHFGFFVTDLSRMAAFYKGALRFTQTDSGDLGAVQLVFLSRDPGEHHQVVLPGHVAFNPINQISFRVPDLATLRRYHARLLEHGASDMQPATHGNAISIYCRDPENNRIEVFTDTPWYCDQPLREPVDFAQSDAEIMARAEAIARRFPKFKSRAAWQQEMAERMACDQSS